jgi:phosphotransferase system HPr (HPr) family protein
MTAARGADAVVRARLADRDGLHARPCARISEIALASRCDVVLRHAGRDARGISIFEMLGLAVPGGAEVEVRVRGPDAAACARRIAAVLAAPEPPGDRTSG